MYSEWKYPFYRKRCLFKKKFELDVYAEEREVSYFDPIQYDRKWVRV